MAYEPTTWKSGDVVTSAKLNHMEQGIAGAGQMIIVRNDPETFTLQSTWQEIYDALKAGVFVYVNGYNESGETFCGAYSYAVTYAALEEGVYHADVFDGSNLMRFITDAATGYPVWED